MRSQNISIIVLLLIGFIAGCGGGEESSTSNGNSGSTTPSTDTGNDNSTTSHTGPTEVEGDTYEIPTITLGGSKDKPTTTKGTMKLPKSSKDVVDALDPLQILIGSWRGVTNNDFGQGKAVDNSSWAWDFLSDPDQPALVFTSKDNPYYNSGRMTWLTDDNKFELKLETPEKQTRLFHGEYTQPVQEVVGDDEKLHRTYKVAFTETEPADEKDAWQLVFNQQENNRFLLEMSKKRGSRFVRMDTVASQRQGTSFALNDEDYGDRTCIISAGLGTSQVSYKGKNYWVCCSGCKAAFEEDPERWLAKLKMKE